MKHGPQNSLFLSLLLKILGPDENQYSTKPDLC